MQDLDDRCKKTQILNALEYHNDLFILKKAEHIKQKQRRKEKF